VIDVVVRLKPNIDFLSVGSCGGCWIGTPAVCRLSCFTTSEALTTCLWHFTTTTTTTTTTTITTTTTTTTTTNNNNNNNTRTMFIVLSS